MSTEITLENLLSANGFYKKKTKIGSAWTYEHAVYMTVNYHNNNTICFNYLGKHMRDKVKKDRSTILDLSPIEKESLYRKALSSLPFHKKIENYISFSLRAKGGDYLIISHNVGINALKEIVKFIVTESGGNYTEIRASEN